MDPGAAKIFCPECGAPAPMRATTVTLVCDYCGSTIVRSGVDLRLVGKVSAITDNGSPILLGSRGRHRQVPFEVTGRLQVGYGRGAWNEWFLTFADGGIGWLADALGRFAILRPRDPAIVAGRIPAFAALRAGTPCTIDGMALTVVDVRSARYLGSEGQLPFVAEPGLVYYAADLRGANGEMVSLDYGNRPDDPRAQPYFGDGVRLAELGLTPVRRFAGWQPPATRGPQ